jgi:branched-chain amino acid transport system permease protein
MMLLPEAMSALVGLLQRTDWGNIPAITEGLVYLKQAAIGLAMVLFLIFEPDGLAHRWQLIKSYWRLYPFSY